MRAGLLRAEIEAAFGDRVAPRERLVIGPEWDRELREIDEGLSSRTWRDVDPDFVREFDALPRLTLRAFCYYLPGYMLACVDEPIASGIGWISAINSLTPPRASLTAEREAFESRAALFDVRQAATIAAFLDAAPALDVLSENPQDPLTKAWNRARVYWRARASSR